MTGERRGHVGAFTRSHAGRTLLAAMAIRCAGALAGTDRAAPPPDWWGDTALGTADAAIGETRLAILLAEQPVHVAISDRTETAA